MMKTYTLLLFLALVACDQQSSPEGRSKLRDEKLAAELDSLKLQQAAVLDSIAAIRVELRQLQKGK